MGRAFGVVRGRLPGVVIARMMALPTRKARERDYMGTLLLRPLDEREWPMGEAVAHASVLEQVEVAALARAVTEDSRRQARQAGAREG
jgi:hypothetical protein